MLYSRTYSRRFPPASPDRQEAIPTFTTNDETFHTIIRPDSRGTFEYLTHLSVIDGPDFGTFADALTFLTLAEVTDFYDTWLGPESGTVIHTQQDPGVAA